jgi:outer membrane protein OmpA-like peptidoglycan-associated protein
MKISVRIALVFSVSHLLLCTAHAQRDVSELETGYYVIVGAFAVQNNAATFYQKLLKEKLNAGFGYSTSRGLYYVYRSKCEQSLDCSTELKKIRKEIGFEDAWLKFIDKQSAPIDEVDNNRIRTDTFLELLAEPGNEVQDSILSTRDVNVDLSNTETFFSLFNAANNRVVEGKVQVIDTERSRLIAEVKGNEYIQLTDPLSSSGRLTLLCDAFGYRKIQHELYYRSPVTDSTESFVEEMGSLLIVNFNLIRYQPGDIHTLYNVFFYNDSNVMMSESKFELNELLVMMTENPSIRIRLHGHTNGHYRGKIKKAGTGNLFSINENVKVSHGSAKTLSLDRAEAIRDFLVLNGVEGSRIETKAWGGKRPLYDKHGANARKNVRVEVELMK